MTDSGEASEYLSRHVYRHKKTGEYISGRSISISSSRRITYFVCCKGHAVFKPKDWEEIEPAVFNRSDSKSIRECVKLYGYNTACYVMTGYGPNDCCSYGVKRACLRGLPSDEIAARFDGLFGRSLLSLSIPIAYVFGVWSFDVIAFEKLLITKGYRPEINETMSEFLIRTRGAEVENFVRVNLLTSAK